MGSHMFPFNPKDWTETYLQTLIGTEENLRLEFKSGCLFEEQKEKIATVLTKEMSAFANCEGGIIVLGMRENKVKRGRNVASELDGINPSQMPRDQLQQLLEANLRPPLPGIRVIAVQLSGSRQGRCVYVIYVPKGSTAYQAKDCLYYNRSEFEAKAMLDHEVRLRMM